jgi:Co/Zn/Cd efflux system component
MAGCCHDDGCTPPRPGALNTPAWRRVLWIALALNGGMFVAEVVAGLTAGSTALQADAIDFLADAANYAISLGVTGLGLGWRARAAFFKGGSLVLLGVFVLGSALWHAALGGVPAAGMMGVVGILALCVNAGVALMLFRFREGDANMRSVWICSRNDAIGNCAVLAAAAGVFGSGTRWPDLAVAAVMAGLGISGGWQVLRRAYGELRGLATQSLAG